MGSVALGPLGNEPEGIITSPAGYWLRRTMTGPPDLCSRGSLNVLGSGKGGLGVTSAVPSASHVWFGFTSAS